MALADVDPNRGMMYKPLPNGGPMIAMCKTEPGIYFDSKGNLVPDEMASAAGYDVKINRATRAKTRAKKSALEKIDAQFAKASSDIDEMTPDEMEEKGLVEPTPKDGATFVTRNAAGEPRTARTTEGGPVKEMSYVQRDQSWKIADQDTGEVYGDGLDKEDATELLLA